MDGDHTIGESAAITGRVLQSVYEELDRHRVDLRGTLLKPNMVLSGYGAHVRAPANEVAVRTLDVLYRHVPAAVTGIVFLSGGQSDEDATLHLNEMNALGSHPWQLSFSFGRALQSSALKAWAENPGEIEQAQQALLSPRPSEQPGALGRVLAGARGADGRCRMNASEVTSQLRSLRSLPQDSSANAPTAGARGASTMKRMKESVIAPPRPRSVRDAEIHGAHVLVRADLNVPLADGCVADDTRIRAALPTLELLRSRGAASITLCSHLGRPNGYDPAFSIEPVRARLEELFEGSIDVLENTRFDPRETANDPEFAQELAKGQDLFVEDAFGSVHRAHASTVAIAELLPAYAGLLLEQELELLGRLLGEVERPFVLVCGGAKGDDKLPVISHLGARADDVLIGGKLAEQLRVSNPFGFPVVFPVDVLGVPRLQPDAESRVCSVDELPYGWAVLDIGPKTAAEFAEIIAAAGTIFWNGPMGLFEWPRFAEGTDIVARAVAESNAFSVVGGADTLRAMNGLGLLERSPGHRQAAERLWSFSPERSYPVSQSSLRRNPGTLVVLRHGESAWNASGLFTGWVDVGLSAARRGRGGTRRRAARAGGASAGRRAYLGAPARNPDGRARARRRRAELDPGAAVVAPERASLRRSAGKEQGADEARVRRRAVHALAPLLRRAAAAPRSRLRASPPLRDPRYADLPPDALPATECLKDVLVRVLPYWYDAIVPDLRAGRVVLVSAHGNSLRALVKHLDGIPDSEIAELNIPTGVPLALRARRRDAARSAASIRASASAAPTSIPRQPRHRSRLFARQGTGARRQTEPHGPGGARATSACDAARCLERLRRNGDRDEHALHEIDEPVRVAPLVVVPGHDLHLRPVDHRRQPCIEDRRERRLDDVGRDERLLAVAEDAGELARSARSRRGSFTSSTVVGRSTSTVRSTSDPVGTGTRTAKPWSFPASSGMTSPTALAAPVVVGTRLQAAARARR